MLPNEVCHYTKKEVALENILCEGRIRLSNLGLVNDPKEFGQLSVPSISIPGDEIKDGSKKLYNFNFEVNRVRTKEWKVLCVTLHRNTKKEIRHIIQKHVRDRFSPGYSRPQMWAHYSGNNSGVCILFDCFKLHENIMNALRGYEIKYGRMDYSNKRGIGPNPVNETLLNSNLVEVAREYVNTRYKQLFLHKYPEWKNESEFRWLAHSKNPSEEFLYVPINGALIEVYAGVNFPEVYEPSIRALCKKLKVPVRKMTDYNGFLMPSQSYIYKP